MFRAVRRSFPYGFAGRKMSWRNRGGRIPAIGVALRIPPRHWIRFTGSAFNFIAISSRCRGEARAFEGTGSAGRNRCGVLRFSRRNRAQGILCHANLLLMLLGVKIDDFLDHRLIRNVVLTGLRLEKLNALLAQRQCDLHRAFFENEFIRCGQEVCHNL